MVANCIKIRDVNRLLGFVCAAVFAMPVIGIGQESISLDFSSELPEKRSFTTMKELSESLLMDPYILTELKVKRSLMAIMPIRSKINNVLLAMSANQAQEANEGDEGVASMVADIRGRHVKSGRLQLGDLNSSQRAQLQKIAMRKQPLHALQTNEVKFALGISDSQLKRLDTIRTDHWTKSQKVFSKFAPKANMESEMKTLSQQMTEDTPVAKRYSLITNFVNKLEAWHIKAFELSEEPLESVLKESNARALRVLTPSQKSRYQQLMK